MKMGNPIVSCSSLLWNNSPSRCTIIGVPFAFFIEDITELYCEKCFIIWWTCLENNYFMINLYMSQWGNPHRWLGSQYRCSGDCGVIWQPHWFGCFVQLETNALETYTWWFNNNAYCWFATQRLKCVQYRNNSCMLTQAKHCSHRQNTTHTGKILLTHGKARLTHAYIFVTFGFAMRQPMWHMKISSGIAFRTQWQECKSDDCNSLEFHLKHVFSALKVGIFVLCLRMWTRGTMHYYRCMVRR